MSVVPIGAGMDGPLEGTRLDPRNGGTATCLRGGKAGDSGSVYNSKWKATEGTMWQVGAYVHIYVYNHMFACIYVLIYLCMYICRLNPITKSPHHYGVQNKCASHIAYFVWCLCHISN